MNSCSKNIKSAYTESLITYVSWWVQDNNRAISLICHHTYVNPNFLVIWDFYHKSITRSIYNFILFTVKPIQHVSNKFNLVRADGEWFIWLESLQYKKIYKREVRSSPLSRETDIWRGSVVNLLHTNSELRCIFAFAGDLHACQTI